MKDLRASLDKRAEELDFGRLGALQDIQALLEEMYPGKARAASLNDGVLKITTISAAVAGDLRLKQVAVLQKFRASGEHRIEKLRITIG